ncbi:hypothetical protein [Tunicatimonas pelagia]|uniref:hypothetical protein n=1 Tax=Tunicatimonas pelagia TaxID=931531 RepID=UPI0026667187|nr:hypothetical protein [Tunicatimonas pelagia]WKN43095.1 hypothetical protein P0M28_29070 [Tunicatimonas pelagia]
MKKFFNLGYLLIFAISTTYAQQYFPSEVWHEGSVTTVDGESSRGKIKYNLETDLIQFSSNNTIKTYSARKIIFFEIFDAEYGRYREFYALPYQMEGDYKAPRLFEVLYENTLTLLCREEIVQQTSAINDPFFYGNQMFTRFRLEYEYYFLDHDGEIQYYSQKKDDLYNMFPKNKAKVEQYIKKNKLKPNRQRDLVRVTAYYNSLLNS